LDQITLNLFFKFGCEMLFDVLTVTNNQSGQVTSKDTTQ